jgi:PKD repeat protein
MVLLSILMLSLSSLFEFGVGEGSEDLEAVFTHSPSEPHVNEEVVFNASESTGNITSYMWDFGDNTAESGMVVNHTYTTAGTYLVTLNVTDNEGLWAAESEDIDVLEEPQQQDELEAKFSFSPTPPYIDEEVSFDASESTGNITSYKWNFGDESVAYGVVANHTYTAVGTYSVTLNVSDSEGSWAVESKDIPILEREDETPTEDQTWVKMMGFVSPHPPPGVYKLRVYAKIGEWAKVYAFYGSQNFPPSSKDGQKSTYSFYAVRLTDASIVELDYSGCDFYVSGTWDVYNITWVNQNHKNATWTLEVMVDDENGTLCVSNAWKNFTIAINGIEPIDGRVIVRIVKTKGAIPQGDINWDRKVNIVDVAAVGKAYGAVPGTLHFDFELDLDNNFQINVVDVAIVAKDFGKEY